jgi:hypothetical protein
MCTFGSVNGHIMPRASLKFGLKLQVQEAWNESRWPSFNGDSCRSWMLLSSSAIQWSRHGGEGSDITYRVNYHGTWWFTTTLIALSKQQNITDHVQIHDLRVYQYLEHCSYFPWFLVEAEAGINYIIRDESHIFNIGFKEWTDPSHFFSSYHKYMTSVLFWGNLINGLWLVPVVGSQNSFIKSVTFAWHGGETLLGTFLNGALHCFSSPFIYKIRFYGSHEAYLSNHVCHQYNFVVDAV